MKCCMEGYQSVFEYNPYVLVQYIHGCWIKQFWIQKFWIQKFWIQKFWIQQFWIQPFGSKFSSFDLNSAVWIWIQQFYCGFEFSSFEFSNSNSAVLNLSSNQTRQRKNVIYSCQSVGKSYCTEKKELVRIKYHSFYRTTYTTLNLMPLNEKSHYFSTSPVFRALQL